MDKRGAIVALILCVLFASTVSATHNSTLSLTPTEFYETNDIDFEFIVNNYMSGAEITKLTAEVPTIVITSVVDYYGWQENFTTNSINWIGSLGTNIKNSVFEFLGEAPRVDSNTTVSVKLTLKYGDNSEQEEDFPIIILDDTTPPDIGTPTPEDGSFIKQGIINQEVSINATDPETGIAYANYTWSNCSEGVNETIWNSINLLETGGFYYYNIDFSNFLNEDIICFRFDIENKGGEQVKSNGTIIIDGRTPTIVLLSPDDKALVGMNSNFSFRATDNLDNSLDCMMYIDEQNMLNLTAKSGITKNVPAADVAEGNHNWRVDCSDDVGWVGSSNVSNYILDKTPPSISMNLANNSVIADNAQVVFTIEDNYNVSRVMYTSQGKEYNSTTIFSLNMSEWPDGPNSIEVYAVDEAGNSVRKTFVVVIDRTAPVVSLVSPVNNSQIDVHAILVYTVLDDYDDLLNCTIILDGQKYGEQEVVSGNNSEVRELLAIGAHNWNVQCIDDAGNNGSSELWLLDAVDLTGPDISHNVPLSIYRGSNMEFELDITDISGVKSVNLTIVDPNQNVQELPLQQNGNKYAATYPTTKYSTVGRYLFNVNAVDTLNNSNFINGNISVKYSYQISLVVSPSSVQPSVSSTASGTVLYDNGSFVLEDEIKLVVPVGQNYSSESVELDNLSSYSYSFEAPTTEGEYLLVARVISLDSGDEFNASAQLTVAVAQQQNNGGGSGGGSGGSGNSGWSAVNDGPSKTQGCNMRWECDDWSDCSNGKKIRVCKEVGCSSEGSRRTDVADCEVKKEEVNDDEDTSPRDVVGKTTNAEEREIQVVEVEEDEGDSAGLFKATGFMSLAGAGPGSIIGVIVLTGVLFLALYRFGWGRVKKRRPHSTDVFRERLNLDLDDYLKKRKKI